MSEAGRFKVVIAPLSIGEDLWKGTGGRGKKGAGAETHRPGVSLEVRMRSDAFDDAGEQLRGVGQAELPLGMEGDADAVERAFRGPVVGEGGDLADAPAAAVDVGLDGRDAVEADAGLG